MPVPKDWNISCKWDQNGVLTVDDPRGVCPFCRHSTTFQVQATVLLPRNLRMANTHKYWIHLILRCNSASCANTSYVVISISSSLEIDRANDYFFMHPSRAIDPAHAAIPKHIAEDWTEAQVVMEAGAVKAAAVMCRRVLYGAVLDKNCKERPLKEGLEQLIQKHRLPAVFDDWLPAITDDGHDAAHPHRALDVSHENVSETMAYTAELLRFLYIMPHEFQERTARNAAKP